MFSTPAERFKFVFKANKLPPVGGRPYPYFSVLFSKTLLIGGALGYSPRHRIVQSLFFMTLMTDVVGKVGLNL